MATEVPKFDLRIVSYSKSDLNLPGFDSPKSLPEELAKSDDVLAFLKLGVTQWSRIAAWTWCDYLAFEHTKLEDKEKKLKKTLISLLTNQSRYADAYLNYGDDPSKSLADGQSQKIVNALLVVCQAKDCEFEGK